ncbi:MAG: glutamine--fructose-6-phosphate transaminase (isomerizing), partial [Paludibacteraceae bacterium]|nr:glutamine--fructose-6-phosphate transaminase (isomerizing) [Paludibacteraceae bacterium]
MCGIVGYIGKQDAYPILINGLQKLEYRGYDSAGCALYSTNGQLNIYKAKGKVADLDAAAQGKDISGTMGIAHTRWATHGAPSTVNAHPHCCGTGRITLVHNGIIENYATLREQLIQKGYEFQSETDTEVLVQLIAYTMEKTGSDIVKAVRLALNQVIGAYAICVIDKEQPEILVCARKSSPMVIGVTADNSEFFVASDASPIAGYTKDMVYIADEQIAVCQRGENIRLLSLQGKEMEANVQQVDLDLSMLTKGGYPHFMLKEIFDQPQVLRDCMRGRLIADEKKVTLSAVEEHRDVLLRARRIVIVSCGTSWHAGLIGKQLIEKFCKIPVEVAYASEYRYSDTVIEPTDVVMAISQSGETADTMAAIEMAKEKGAFVYGVVNAVGSSIARASHAGTYIHVGPEIGVASTKAFTGQVTVLTMFALALGHLKGTISQSEYEETIAELSVIPEKIEKTLQQNAT